MSTDRGHELSARYCVMAVGCLSVPKFPEVPGLDEFTGPWYHTARWPEGGVDFTGQRVGVIGTGSSGIQAIPFLAEQARELTVFQRTPNYSLAAFNRPLDPARVAEVKANYRRCATPTATPSSASRSSGQPSRRWRSATTSGAPCTRSGGTAGT
nr:hypothetical protein GCM10017745_42280 [Saccharothrix mutabilis subsp. capreolus]